MLGVLLLTLQSIAPGHEAPAAANSLLRPVPSGRCDVSPTEITVCARKTETYRLPKLDPGSAAKPLPKAEWRIFGDAKMGVGFAPRPSGAPAVQATVTIPF